MKYHSVADTAKSWNISERTVRNYCATGKIPGAVLTGKTWNIPQDAKRPARTNKKPEAPRTLLDVLQNEMNGQVKGGIYHKIQIDLTYNSNHIEGSRLTHDQTGLLEDYQILCKASGHRGGYHTAYSAAFLCGALNRKRCGLALCAGNAGSFRYFHHADLYEADESEAEKCIRKNASPCVNP